MWSVPFPSPRSLLRHKTIPSFPIPCLRCRRFSATLGFESLRLATGGIADSYNGQATGKIISGRRIGLWTSCKNEFEEQRSVRRDTSNVSRKSIQKFYVLHLTVLRSQARMPYGMRQPTRSGCLKMGPHFLHIGLERIWHGKGRMSAQLEDRPVDHV
jgi:hypothetical protein